MTFEINAGQSVHMQNVVQQSVKVPDNAASRHAVEMNGHVRIVDPLQYQEWNDMVCSLPGYSFFHSANWAMVLHKSYGYSLRYFAIMNDEKLHALIPLMEVSSLLTGRRGVSLPFTDYCEPIAATGIPVRDVVTALIEYGMNAGWRHVDFRGQGCVAQDVPCFTQYYRHVISLSADPDKVAVRFRDSTRRNIRKAMQAGVSVAVFDTWEALVKFQHLNCKTRKTHGLPPQPAAFFKNIYQYILAEGLGIVIIATHKGKTVAAAVFFHLGKKAIYKFGAWDRRFQSLRANNLVLWKAIEWYCGKGCTTLCLGRTDLDAPGLCQYKAGWAPEQELISYYRLDLRKGCFVVGNGAKNAQLYGLLSLLPAPVLKVIGTLFYQHMG